MTRIVSGFARSLTLQVPPRGTRPTSDRVREAVFSALEARDAVMGAHVLDLYAGTGALGLEAASRGASSVTLVEAQRDAAAVCSRNGAAVQAMAPAGTKPTIRVLTDRVDNVLRHRGEPVDLVFVDPPYALSNDELHAVLDALTEYINEDAIVCVERSARDAMPHLPEDMTMTWSRSYGDTIVFFLERVAD